MAVKIVLGINLSYNAILQRNAVDKPHTANTTSTTTRFPSLSPHWEIPQPTAERFIQVDGEHHVAKKRNCAAFQLNEVDYLLAPGNTSNMIDQASDAYGKERERVKPHKPHRLCPHKKRQTQAEN